MDPNDAALSSSSLETLLGSDLYGLGFRMSRTARFEVWSDCGKLALRQLQFLAQCLGFEVWSLGYGLVPYLEVHG